MKFYLKFNSEEVFKSAVDAHNENASLAHQIDYNDERFVIHRDFAKETGETHEDQDGNTFPVMVPVEGYHVDAYFDELPNDLKPYQISTPNNPINKLR